MIHASAKTRHPVEQGLWGSFEVFFDTFVVCSITALSVILSGMWTDGTNGGTLALSAFSSSFGTVGSLLLAVIMVIFTVTTSGGWFTYYLAILEHLYKKEGLLKTIIMKIFYAIRVLPGLLWTIYLVKTDNQGFIWTLVDITSAIPTFVNVAVILILSNQYFKLLKDDPARYLGSGKGAEPLRRGYEAAAAAGGPFIPMAWFTRGSFPLRRPSSWRAMNFCSRAAAGRHCPMRREIRRLWIWRADSCAAPSTTATCTC